MGGAGADFVFAVTELVEMSDMFAFSGLGEEETGIVSTLTYDRLDES